MLVPSRLIILILIFIAVLAISFVLLWPKYQDFQSAVLKLRQKEAELNSKTAYYSQINKTWDELKKYEDALTKVDSAIPGNYSIPALFSYFQNTASDTGLVLRSLTIGNAAGDGIKQIDINAELSGTYSSLKSFISSIENSERFFGVESVKLSSGKDKISFNLKLATYSY